MTLIALPKDVLWLKTEFSFSLAHRKIIDQICDGIGAVGLLNPLIVTKVKGRYLVVDGKKRLHAIKKLARLNRLPRTLNTVPCLVTDSDPVSIDKNEKPILLSDIELVQEILLAETAGVSVSDIETKLECSQEFISQALSLKKLDEKLIQAFLNNAINLEQASALATIPNPNAQWDLLLQLGPFATQPEIISAIASGSTVLELPNGDVLLLPSRATKASQSKNLLGIENLQLAA